MKYRACALGFFLLSSCAAQQPVVLPSSPLVSNYKVFVDKWVGEHLKDPASRIVNFTSANDIRVCGTVNARNSLGGMTGNNFFFVVMTGETVADGAILSPDEASRFGGLLTYNPSVTPYLRSCGFLP